MMDNVTEEELKSHDGIVVVGGDGIFNEVINGLALKRHQDSSILRPHQIAELIAQHTSNSSRSGEEAALLDETRSSLDTEEAALLDETRSSLDTASDSPHHISDSVLLDALSQRSLLFPWLRFGIIPAGSTDTIVVSTTGTRDPVTAALHIIVGDSMPLDLARFTGWKNSKQNEAAKVLYAASFAGYGFYGDVAQESENMRWMGPSRYDYAGTKVFMLHRSYDADVSFLDIPSVPETSNLICRADCRLCAKDRSLPERLKWRTTRAFFQSVGAVIMACRNDKAPDGVVAQAHLGDGMLHLVLVKKCSRPAYLLHLLQLAKKGGTPLSFDFVEHHKTPIFTFVSRGEESVWNVDGEIFAANKFCGQVFKGLINIFARGPEE